MLKPRRPSPGLVVACIALAIALGGVGYAAVTLPKNSVGSPQVKSNSLSGNDINEASLKGVVLGKGAARAGNKVLGTGTAFVTGFTIPSTGRFEVDCLGGSTNHRFRNTTGSDATVWIERGEPDTVFATVAPGTAGGKRRRATPSSCSGSSAQAARRARRPRSRSRAASPARSASSSSSPCGSRTSSPGGRYAARAASDCGPRGSHQRAEPSSRGCPGLLADRASSPGTRRLGRRVAHVRRRGPDSFCVATMRGAARWPSG